jgi:hypothetical protein
VCTAQSCEYNAVTWGRLGDQCCDYLGAHALTPESTAGHQVLRGMYTVCCGIWHLPCSPINHREQTLTEASMSPEALSEGHTSYEAAEPWLCMLQKCETGWAPEPEGWYPEHQDPPCMFLDHQAPQLPLSLPPCPILLGECSKGKAIALILGMTE